MPPSPGPIIVRAPDLARAYRADKSAAELAYTHQRVVVYCHGFVVRGNEIHWHLASNKVPAVVVFRFPQPPMATGPVWILGTCSGSFRDGQAREFDGYEFHIVISDCALVPPPSAPSP